MNITLKSVPQEQIRANQCGDWWVFADNCFTIHVLETMPPESQFAVAIHELIEAYLCRKAGISDESVCRWDEQFEKEREEGKHKEDDENGDDLRAPYHKEHVMATFIEKLVCSVIDLNWRAHELSVLESATGLPKTECLASVHPE